jgi:hypothetical protein
LSRLLALGQAGNIKLHKLSCRMLKLWACS